MGYSPRGHKESDMAECACIPLIEMCPKEIVTEVYEDTNERTFAAWFMIINKSGKQQKCQPRFLPEFFPVSLAIARQKVISITLTVERTGNSDDYNEILRVTSHVPIYLAVSEESRVMVRGEGEEKYPRKQFLWSLMI